MLKVTGSTSTKTGLAPIEATAPAVAAKVKAGTKTASPGFTPIAISAIISASRPLDTAIACAGAGKGGEPLLEVLDLRTEDELPVGEHGIDPRLEIAFEPRPLALQVEEADPVVIGDGKRPRGTHRGHQCSATPFGTRRRRRAARVGDRREDHSASFSASSPAWPSTSGGVPSRRRCRGTHRSRPRGCRCGGSAIRSAATAPLRRGDDGQGSGAARSATSRRPGSVTAMLRSAVGATRLAASVATTPFAKTSRASATSLPSRDHRHAARRDRDDRRRRQRQHQVDVVDHQVEDDVDVERRAPTTASAARTRSAAARAPARGAHGRPARSARYGRPGARVPRRAGARDEVGRGRNVGGDRLLDEEMDAGIDQVGRDARGAPTSGP